MKIYVNKKKHIRSIEFCCDSMSSSLMTWCEESSIYINCTHGTGETTVNTTYFTLQYCPFCGSKIEVLSD